MRSLLAVLLVVTACAADEAAGPNPCVETAESIAGCIAEGRTTQWTASVACNGTPVRTDGSVRDGGRRACFRNEPTRSPWLCCDEPNSVDSDVGW